MHRQPIENSSSVKSVGYDPDDQTMEVEFAGGKVYRYMNVPQQVHDNMVSSPSVGAFLYNRVKDRFAHERV